MKVILDSNIICGDFQLSGSAFRVLFEGLQRTGHSLLVPELVLDEAINKYEEELMRCSTNMDKQLRRIRAVAGTTAPNPFSATSVHVWLSDYRLALRRKLEQAGAAFLPYPDSPHQHIVQKALQRKKPFSKSGAGYRDALIWESILAATAGSDEPTALVTSNHKDFCDGTDLHPDLVADLEALAISADSVEVYQDLQAFVDAAIKPSLEVLDDTRTRLAKGRYPGIDLMVVLGERLPESLIGMELDPFSVGFPQQYESPTISHVGEISNLYVDSVRQMPSGELLISAEVDAAGEIDIFIFKQEFDLNDDSEVTLEDRDWNEHYVFASTSKVLRVGTTLTIQPEESEVTSIAVDWVSVPDM